MWNSLGGEISGGCSSLFRKWIAGEQGAVDNIIRVDSIPGGFLPYSRGELTIYINVQI